MTGWSFSLNEMVIYSVDGVLYTTTELVRPICGRYLLEVGISIHLEVPPAAD